MRGLFVLGALLGSSIAGCGGGGGDPDPDAGIQSPDARTGCEPAAVLPAQYRPIAEVSAGAVTVTTPGEITTGTVDATAGGMSSAADNPYIYVDLTTGTKVDVDDVQAYGSMTWDIALKRSSLRTNGGDSGPGGRTLTVVPTTTDDPLQFEITGVPATPYVADTFVTEDCMLIQLDGGEPMSAFGQWYDYDDNTHVVTPKSEAYVVQRPDGSHTAFRVVEYYGDTTMPMRGAYYQVEWKQL